MKHLSFALLLLAAPLLLPTSLAGCVAEEDDEMADLAEEPDATDLAETAQQVARGWFFLEQNGIGYVSGSAAGIAQDLTIRYDQQGYGYASAYTQRWNTSPPVNHVTMLVRLDCADGQVLYNSTNYVLNTTGNSHISLFSPSCPRYVRAVKAYFAMHVDN